MKKYMKYMLLIIMMSICNMVLFAVPAFAATANIDIPAQNIGAGEEVTVDVNVTSDQNIGTFDLRITYDTSVLEYVSGADNGGSGVIQVLNSELNQTNTVKKQIVFKALKEGSSDITVQAASSNVLDMSANAMDIAGGTGTVTVGNNTGNSSDNNLTSLSVNTVSDDGTTTEVALTPSFSKDVTDYSLLVGDNIKKLSIAVTSSDVSAATKITGTKLDAGDNLTTISVTAPNGDVKEYKIYTTKGGEGNATPETPADNTEVLPLPEDLSPKKVDSIGKYVVQTFDAVGIPEGFTAQGYQYGDMQIAALMGNVKKITLICLADDENGANAALFVYNSSADTFSLYNNLTVNDKVYTMLTPEKEVNIPEGYSETSVKINDVDTVAWENADNKEILLVYAINWDGEKGFYLYDTKEQTMMRYSESKSVSNDGDSQWKSKYEDMKTKHEDDNFVKLEIVIGFIVICLILVIYSSVLLYKLRKLQPEDVAEEPKKNNDLQQGEKELKLDMAMQANEVKTETLANDVNTILDGPLEMEEESNKEDLNDNDIAEESQNTVSQSSETEIMNNAIPVEADVKKESEDADDNQSTDDLGIVFVDLEDDNK